MRREESKQLLVEIPVTLAAQLDRACQTQHSTKGGLVRKALEVYLDHLRAEGTKTFVVELSDGAAELLSAYREASDFPDRSRITESALRDYIDTRINESQPLRKRMEEARKARSKVVSLKEARKE